MARERPERSGMRQNVYEKVTQHWSGGSTLPPEQAGAYPTGDFTRMLSVFEKHKVSFVAVTQQFNTSTSLGRLTLNILLSFAQFERELIGERTRDKMSAARRKGKWVGGCPVLGYDVDPAGGRLVVNEQEAERVRAIFALFEETKSIL